MPRKKSVKKSATEFKDRADEIAAFVTEGVLELRLRHSPSVLNALVGG